ncbi:tetratricopeptide repeat protein [Novosphingobium album (ex Liu et al. 2023)]|uniref:Tetratricopeptide repeat protein n=1 Tax=Novosphingobium album (ex Liu et al. 2023) TaxID=3031130 RepID=A0ABT5WVB5_9SPHN|nr:tetratricopeptide repeat protein [Novosphingobium album (ex Liu et al. 2023)]MDE8653789.1 hypothetical protein [Novosphingobium album (ex Liu et al. 2023)]
MSIFALVLLGQVGAAPAIGADPLQLPAEVRDRKPRTRQVQTVEAPPGPQIDGCIAEMETDPVHGADAARKALAEAKGEERVRAGLCLGIALTQLERWDEAQRAFSTARSSAMPDDHASRARLGSMAGNAAFAGGQPDSALALFDSAQTEARQAGDGALGGAIAIDRARALVTLGRNDEAAAALAEARALAPDNAQAWLLSATLSRRMDKLLEAQAQIEKAAQIAPEDPETGLEAGVIAMLSGREDAARRSWQSVLATAPESAAAATAKGYLAQLGNGGPAKP